MERQVSLIFKAARLVNTLILMYATESIPIHYHFAVQTKLLLNFHMNLTFSILIIFDFIRENVSLCFALGRSEIRMELAGIQCLAQRHFSRQGARCCGPRAQLHCPATPTLTADMNLKDSVLH